MKMFTLSSLAKFSTSLGIFFLILYEITSRSLVVSAASESISSIHDNSNTLEEHFPHPLKDSHYISQSSLIPLPLVGHGNGHGISLLYILRPQVIPPFSGNISISHEKISTISMKKRLLFTIEAEIPWRKIKFTFHKNSNENLDCSLDEMLHAHREYSLFIHLSYDQELLSLLIYMNGKLQNSCFHYVSENIFTPPPLGLFDRQSQNGLSLTIDGRDTSIMTIKDLYYWNHPLTYRDVQYVSSLSSSLLHHQQNLLTADQTPHLLSERIQRNWINRFLPSDRIMRSCEVTDINGEESFCQLSSSSASPTSSSPASSSSNVSKVSIILWPSFYTHGYPTHSISFLTEQIYESIWNILLSLNENTNTNIFIPILTSDSSSSSPSSSPSSSSSADNLETFVNPLYTSLIAHFQRFHSRPLTSSHLIDFNSIISLLSKVYVIPIQMNSYTGTHLHSLFSFSEATYALLSAIYPSLTSNSNVVNEVNEIQFTSKGKKQKRLLKIQSNSIESLSIARILLKDMKDSNNEMNFNLTQLLTNASTLLLTPPDYFTFLSSHIYPYPGWLTSLVMESTNRNNQAIVGGKILSSTGFLTHYGHELFELPFTGGTEILLVPHDRFRGYWPNDERTLTTSSSLSISRDMMLIPVTVWTKLSGFDSITSPHFEDSDFCLRAFLNLNVTTYSSGDSIGISLLSHSTTIDTNPEYTSKLFSPVKLSSVELGALREYSTRWREVERRRKEANYLTKAKLTWVIHCGGSQGLEAATILQTLYQYLDVRTLVRRYRMCEHSDTLSGMPSFFRDILETTSLKSFTPPYQGFNKPYRSCNNSYNDNDNDHDNDNGLKRECSNEPNPDEMEDGSIVLYARDYREIGRWVPHDTSYLIGRYMYETDGLPSPWVRHLNNIDEVWVPSQWQKDTFVSSGAIADKIEIMHETVDNHFFNPLAVNDLALPGTILDGYDRNDPNRPYAFCSVFKMEMRKGWKELVEGFMREFATSPNVVLILRTYLHTGTGISADNFNRVAIRKEIDDHLKWHGLNTSDSSNGLDGPRIEIVSEHLPSWQLVSLYKSCDAFVLPTHAEGWGLPTHEAMIMGLPVITTNWGGSTEFVTNESGLLIDTYGFSPTEADNWLKGFQWASIHTEHFQQQMRKLYSNRSFGVELGLKGKQHMLKFSPDAVAQQYARRIARIQNEIIPHLDKNTNDQTSLTNLRYHSHGELVASKLDVRWSLSTRFKTCSIRTYKKLFHGNLTEFILSPGDVEMTNTSSISASSPAAITTPITTPTTTQNRHPHCNIVIITTWSPRMCGIATFSEALRNGLINVCPNGSRIDIVAVKHKDQSSSEYNSDEVKFTFREYEVLDYVEAAQFINKKKYHTVLVQYEYGMLYGDNLVCLMRELSVPMVITTLHTVHVHLDEHIHAWVQQVAFLSNKMVVMTHSMRHSLSVYHAIPTRDIAVIPHGGPDLPYERYDGTPLQTLYPGKKVILSNGLIHQMKGIEYVIRAMPRILQEVPNAVYLIHGRPHPSGTGCEEYYQSIQQEAQLLAPNNIYFNRSYAYNEDLYEMLKNARAYVNAYTDEGQSVSGTLAMALSIGTVSVSTPYSYAIEMLKNNTGKLIPFRNVDALADAIIEILNDDNEHEEMSRKAYMAAQSQTWKKVAKGYLNLH